MSGPRFTIRIQRRGDDGTVLGAKTIDVPVPPITAKDEKASVSIDDALARVGRRTQAAALELLEDFPIVIEGGKE